MIHVGVKHMLCFLGSVILAFLALNLSQMAARFELMEREVKFTQGAGPDDFQAGDMLLVAGPLKVRNATVPVGDIRFKDVFLVRETVEGRRGRWKRRFPFRAWLPISTTSYGNDSATIGDWHVAPEVLQKMQGDGEIALPGADFAVPEGWYADGESIREWGRYRKRYTYSVWRPGGIYTVIARKGEGSDLLLFDTGLPLDDDYAFVQSGAMTSLDVLHDGNLRERQFAFCSLMGFFLLAWTGLALYFSDREIDTGEDSVAISPLLSAFLLSALLTVACLFMTEGPLYGYSLFILISLPLAALFFLRGRRRRGEENREDQ